MFSFIVPYSCFILEVPHRIRIRKTAFSSYFSDSVSICFKRLPLKRILSQGASASALRAQDGRWCHVWTQSKSFDMTTAVFSCQHTQTSHSLLQIISIVIFFILREKNEFTVNKKEKSFVLLKYVWNTASNPSSSFWEPAGGRRLASWMPFASSPPSSPASSSPPSSASPRSSPSSWPSPPSSAEAWWRSSCPKLGRKSSPEKPKTPLQPPGPQTAVLTKRWMLLGGKKETGRKRRACRGSWDDESDMVLSYNNKKSWKPVWWPTWTSVNPPRLPSISVTP